MSLTLLQGALTHQNQSNQVAPTVRPLLLRSGQSTLVLTGLMASTSVSSRSPQERRAMLLRQQ